MRRLPFPLRPGNLFHPPRLDGYPGLFCIDLVPTAPRASGLRVEISFVTALALGATHLRPGNTEFTQPGLALCLTFLPPPSTVCFLSGSAFARRRCGAVMFWHRVGAPEPVLFYSSGSSRSPSSSDSPLPSLCFIVPAAGCF